MYISKMRLENFRCFEGVKELTFNSGVNYFVGNNNCGKTTIFRAIEFLKSAKTKDGWITKGKEDEDVSVEITLEGENLADFLEQDDLKKVSTLPYQRLKTNNQKKVQSLVAGRMVEEKTKRFLLRMSQLSIQKLEF